jgi:hypothetical protein
MDRVADEDPQRIAQAKAKDIASLSWQELDAYGKRDEEVVTDGSASPREGDRLLGHGGVGFDDVRDRQGLPDPTLASVLGIQRGRDARRLGRRRSDSRPTGVVAIFDPGSDHLIWASVRECHPSAERSARSAATSRVSSSSGINRMRGSGPLGVVHWPLMKQKQYSSMPPEPSPGARKCSLSTIWLWPPTKGL